MPKKPNFDEPAALKPEVSVPWKACLLMALLFGIALCISPQNDNWLLEAIRYVEFHKLHWVQFGAFGLFVVITMVSISKFSNARAIASLLISFLFNGMVGGYLGIAIWHFYTGDHRSGTEFLGWAWVTYIWFFLSLNVAKHGIESQTT